jgi:hypothetical protein
MVDSQRWEGPWTRAGAIAAIVALPLSIAIAVAQCSNPGSSRSTSAPPSSTPPAATTSAIATGTAPTPTLADDANSDSRPAKDPKLARVAIQDEGTSLRPDGTYSIGKDPYASVQPHWHTYLSNNLPLTVNDICTVDVTLTSPDGSVVRHVDPSHLSGPYTSCEQQGTQGHYHLSEPGIYTLHVKVTYRQDTKELTENITVVR